MNEALAKKEYPKALLIANKILEKFPNLELVLEIKRYLELQVTADPEAKDLGPPITAEEWEAADHFDASRPDVDPVTGEEYDDDEDEEEDESDDDNDEEEEESPKKESAPSPAPKPKPKPKPKSTPKASPARPRPLVEKKVKIAKPVPNVKVSVKNFPSTK